MYEPTYPADQTDQPQNQTHQIKNITSLLISGVCMLAGRLNTTSHQSGTALYGGTAVNCTLVGNTAGHQGGGVCGASVINSILYDNHASI